MMLNFGVICFALINRTEFGAGSNLLPKQNLKYVVLIVGPGISGSILDLMEAICKGLRKVGNNY